MSRLRTALIYIFAGYEPWFVNKQFACGVDAMRALPIRPQFLSLA